jgi:hypothetical protein
VAKLDQVLEDVASLERTDPDLYHDMIGRIHRALPAGG